MRTLPNDWLSIRKVLWDDDEHILIAENVRRTKPIRQASHFSEQPAEQFCCANGFKPGSSRKKMNVKDWHTLVIEFDDIPIEEQRELWEKSDFPHTLRVFSGNKSIHVFIRVKEALSASQYKRLTDALKVKFPNADMNVLCNPAAFCRTPNGTRENGERQTVEYIGKRVPIADLKKWIEKQGVTKVTKVQRTKKNPPSVSPSDVKQVDRGLGHLIRESARAKAEYRRTKPERARLYETLVERRFVAEPRNRNTVLTRKLIPFLFDAVSKKIGLEFAECFHQFNRMTFRDPFSEHMEQAAHVWNALEKKYPERLHEDEKEFYEILQPRERDLFRIARSLALDVDKCPEGPHTFNLPMHHHGTRLGFPPRNGTQVGRIIIQFRTYGIIELVKRGKSHHSEKGNFVEGERSVYRWLLGQDRG